MPIAQQGIYERAGKVIKTSEFHLLNLGDKTKFRSYKPPLRQAPKLVYPQFPFAQQCITTEKLNKIVSTIFQL